MTGLDEDWMRRALELAERGRGWVEPNPLVGAVVVRDGVAVGEGWHQRFGEAHAEINALALAGEAARGATLFVTLEPCCHQGKTPPCSDAILRAGARRIVVAMSDPFPEVAGKGIERLRSADVEVQVGVCQAQARDLNRPYLTLLRLGRPYVHAKWAMSLDGRIAARTGHSKWITGDESRRHVRILRGRMDAIIVGSGTVRADDPLLTARPPGPRVAVRIVLSGSAESLVGSRLLASAREVPLMVATPAGRGNHGPIAGCEVLELPAIDGKPSVPALLEELGRRRMTNVLVEGGAAALGSFHDAGLIDELHVYVAPKVIGGKDALAPVGGLGLETVDGGRPLTSARWEQIGSDLYANARFTLADEPA
jgi:diaminohydroxyphosphoribosylaminopyrimidine deaminase / 5-amino-6-(5-phosphoribosylamino)uracil reductase